jgi:heavy metal sensor kinase
MLWYAAIFVVTATIAFALFYFLMIGVIRQRADDDLLAQSNEILEVYSSQGDAMLERVARLQAQAAGEKKMFFRLLYPSGVVFSSSNMTYWKSIAIDRFAVEAVIQDGQYRFATQRLPDDKHEVRIIYRRIGGTIVLQLGLSLESAYRPLLAYQQIFLLAMSGLLLVALAMGWFMGRRALAGVESVTRIARQISQDDLTLRVPIDRRYDEIDRLAVTFNQMLDRIEELVNNVRQMSDNIAHDLRSPITRIRGLAEVTLTAGRTLEDYGQMAGSTIEECDRLLDMINTMLTISRTEAGLEAVQNLPVDLSGLIREACELFHPLAEDRKQLFDRQIQDGVVIAGDRGMLQRLAANLIDNAIKYTPIGGKVTVCLRQSDLKQIELLVSDTGIGIRPEDQPKVFDRFFRGDQSRSHGGAGLGLSLAQAIARAHGGQIEVAGDLNRGSRFTVRLPAS